MKRQSKKIQTITELFQYCQKKGNLEFDNDIVKQISKKVGFGNPFDATKLDSTDKFPPILLKNDYFIIHLGNGRHKFIKGISNAFHKFETISPDNCKQWEYKPSILNEFDSSESNILSLVFNQRIIHEFLYSDLVAQPKIYRAKHTKTGFNYLIGNETINATNLQMKIDLTSEYNEKVTIFKSKNDFPNDFAIYQLYFPFLYYHNLKQEKGLQITDINCCYILHNTEGEQSTIRIYQYNFSNIKNMASINLIKNIQYNFIKR